jgi:UDP-3-O-[3-hydroxymyristoyl] glucosamine N-acyltransferase
MIKKPLKMRLGEIAERLQGQIAGNGNREISGVAPFETAGENDISFVAEAKFIKQMDISRAGALIVPLDCRPAARDLIRVKNPKAAFARVMGLFYPPPEPDMFFSDKASLGEAFTYGRDVTIGPFVCIGAHVTVGDRVVIHSNAAIGDGVAIGNDVVIEPNVTIFERCTIGNRVIIHAGTVIGSDGFGFAADGDSYVKIPQTGDVVIEDDVEIGANNTIDRATFATTRIQRGVKTDNLVHVAHNVTVGENTVIVAQAGISGSVTIGRHVIIAGQAGIAQHLSIGDHAIVGPQSGIAKSIGDNEIITGSPGMPHRQFLKVQRIVQGLPELKKMVSSLEKRLEKIEAHIKATL